MKSNRSFNKNLKIRALLFLALITFSFCDDYEFLNQNQIQLNRNEEENVNFDKLMLGVGSGLNTENKATSKNKNKNKSKSKMRSKQKSSKSSTSSEPDNTWDNGYKFPKFQVKKDQDKEYISLGEVWVWPKNMQIAEQKTFPTNNEENLTEDQLGFVMQLDILTVETAKELPFIHSLGSKRVSIPWRFFKSKPYYSNPAMDNKTIGATIEDDKGVVYNLKFTLPYKTIGWYINNTQAETICNICHKMSQRQNKLISSYKAKINQYYTDLETNTNLKNTIPELEAQIKEKADKAIANEQKLKTMNNRIDSYNHNLNPLVIKRKILTDRIVALNEQIEIYKRKIEELNNKDPNMEKRATEDLEKNKKLLKEKLKDLLTIAPDKKQAIEGAEDALLLINGTELEIELRKIGPLRNQA